MVWEWLIVGSRQLMGLVGLVGLGVVVGGCAGGGSAPFSPVPYTGGSQPSTNDDDDGATDGGPDDGGGPNDGNEGADEGLDDGLDDGGASDCCMRHKSPGCSEPAAEACVCDELPQCCGEEWTQECVEEGVLLGCLQCGAGDEGGELDEGGDTGAPMNLGSCCLSGDGPGCAEEQLMSCVCDEDPFCCDSLWDDACAAMVEELGCGDCPGGDDGGGDGGMPADDGGMPADDGGAPGDDGGAPGDGGGMPTGGPCCTAKTDPLCGNLIIEACVCLEDPFCCLFSWDATCVAEVESLMCGSC